MSNYLAQIAARSSGDQLTPAQEPVVQGMDDPFGEGMYVPPVVPVIETTNNRVDQSITNIFPTDTISKTVQENVTNTTRVTEIKPVYLSKYIERNQYAEYKSEIPVIKTAPQIQLQSIENISGETNQFTTVNQTTLRPKTIESESATIVLPGIDTTHVHKEQVFLQPQAPVQQQAQPQQKEKPAPLLVIGIITVEIIPAQKPVNKIINHVIKQPANSASATAKKSNYGFGLGQL